MQPTHPTSQSNAYSSSSELHNSYNTKRIVKLLGQKEVQLYDTAKEPKVWLNLLSGFIANNNYFLCREDENHYVMKLRQLNRNAAYSNSKISEFYNGNPEAIIDIHLSYSGKKITNCGKYSSEQQSMLEVLADKELPFNFEQLKPLENDDISSIKKFIDSDSFIENCATTASDQKLANNLRQISQYLVGGITEKRIKEIMYADAIMSADGKKCLGELENKSFCIRSSTYDSTLPSFTLIKYVFIKPPSDSPSKGTFNFSTTQAAIKDGKIICLSKITYKKGPSRSENYCVFEDKSTKKFSALNEKNYAEKQIKEKIEKEERLCILHTRPISNLYNSPILYMPEKTKFFEEDLVPYEMVLEKIREANQGGTAFKKTKQIIQTIAIENLFKQFKNSIENHHLRNDLHRLLMDSNNNNCNLNAKISTDSEFNDRFLSCLSNKEKFENLSKMLKCSLTSEPLQTPVINSATGCTFEKSDITERYKNIVEDRFTKILLNIVSPLKSEAEIENQKYFINGPMPQIKFLKNFMKTDQYFVCKQDDNHYVMVTRLSKESLHFSSKIFTNELREDDFVMLNFSYENNKITRYEPNISVSCSSLQDLFFKASKAHGLHVHPMNEEDIEHIKKIVN